MEHLIGDLVNESLETVGIKNTHEADTALLVGKKCEYADFAELYRALWKKIGYNFSFRVETNKKNIAAKLGKVECNQQS